MCRRATRVLGTGFAVLDGVRTSGAVSAPVGLSAPPLVQWGVSTRALTTLVLAVALPLALGVRMSRLSSYGFSADELNKVEAIAEFRHGRFTANAEHPLLMKLAMWASLDAAAAWTRAVPSRPVAPEAALRFPNAIAGAATTGALYGVALLLFGPLTAAVAAVLWALDVNAIAINRIGKEDTFLLLFFLLGICWYERGKRRGIDDVAGAQRWYTLSGVSFGLMLASKYMPHFFGLFGVANMAVQRDAGANCPDRRWHWGAVVVAFLAANFAILLPSTWRHFGRYVGGGLLAHHGFPYDGQLFVTDVPVSPLGVPPWYYLHLLVTKVPLVVLAAAGAGMAVMARRPRDRGVVIVRVVGGLTLLGYSLMAAKFQRYALPMLALLDLVAAVGAAAVLHWLWRTLDDRWMRVPAVAALVVLLAGSLLTAQRQAAPFYSLHQNAIGAWLAPPGHAFPEETYDYGVREAVQAVAVVAAPGAVIVSDVPAVVRHYLARTGRTDLVARSLSSEGLPMRAADVWLLAQAEHRTFENDATVAQVRQRMAPWRRITAHGAVAVDVFRLRQRAR